MEIESSCQRQKEGQKIVQKELSQTQNIFQKKIKILIEIKVYMMNLETSTILSQTLLFYMTIIREKIKLLRQIINSS